MSLHFHVLIHEHLAKWITSVTSRWCEAVLCECPDLPREKLQPGGTGIFVLHCISVCVYVSTYLCVSVCACACIRIIHKECCRTAFLSCLRSTLLCASSAQVSFLLIASSFSGIYYKRTLQTFFFPHKNFNFRNIQIQTFFFAFCTTILIAIARSLKIPIGSSFHWKCSSIK